MNKIRFSFLISKNFSIPSHIKINMKFIDKRCPHFRWEVAKAVSHIKNFIDAKMRIISRKSADFNRINRFICVNDF